MTQGTFGGCRGVQNCARNCTSCSDLRFVFSYHSPDDVDQVRAMQEIREKAHDLAHTIMVNAPSCADRSAAIRKIREAMMTANAAIILKGKS